MAWLYIINREVPTPGDSLSWDTKPIVCDITTAFHPKLHFLLHPLFKFLNSGLWGYKMVSGLKGSTSISKSFAGLTAWSCPCPCLHNISCSCVITCWKWKDAFLIHLLWTSDSWRLHFVMEEFRLSHEFGISPEETTKAACCSWEDKHGVPHFGTVKAVLDEGQWHLS